MILTFCLQVKGKLILEFDAPNDIYFFIISIHALYQHLSHITVSLPLPMHSRLLLSHLHLSFFFEFFFISLIFSPVVALRGSELRPRFQIQVLVAQQKESGTEILDLIQISP